METINVFEEFGLSHELLKSIEVQGIVKPTEIQGKSIPHIVKGKDIIGESATGSGKTLAFGCGIIESVKPGDGLQSLVLAPTRELAEQIKDSLSLLSSKLKIITVYGGVSINPQIDGLKRSEIVVATPGRMLDHIKRGTINTSKIKILVLDEADRMLDMGFIYDVERIISTCPRKRQTMIFSATLSSQIKNLASKHMINPTRVKAESFVDPTKLTQVYYNVKKQLKLSLLVHMLKNHKAGLDMIFCNSRTTTNFVVKNLKANKIKAIGLHGGLSQNQRIKTLQMFNDSKFDVLVCTDVAARGLHIGDVSKVYNYEIPRDSKDYVHRIGRTARAGESGEVVNLLAEFDYDNFSRVLAEYREFNIEKVEVPIVDRVQTIKTFDRGNNGKFNRGNNRRSFQKRRRYN